MRKYEIISVQRTLLDSLMLLVDVCICVCVCVLCECVCLGTESRLLLFMVAVFSKVMSDTGSANKEPRLLKETQE